MIKVRFRLLDGKLLTLESSGDALIHDLQNEIAHQIDVASQDITFVYQSSIIDSSQTLSSLHYTESDFIVVHTPPSQPHPPQKIVQKLSSPASREILAFLTEFDNESAAQDQSPQTQSDSTQQNSQQQPPEVAQKEIDIDKLVSMRFRRDQAIKCYDECNGDFESAVLYLVSGKKPQIVTKPQSTRIKDSKQDLPKPAAPIPRQPQVDVSALAQHQFGQLRPLVDGLSMNEKIILLRLLPLGNDDQTTFQVFIACDKDETITRNLLQEMAQ